MNRAYVLATLASALALSSAHSAVVNLVPNGGFEAPDPQHPDWPLGFAPSRTDAVAGVTSAGVAFAWEQTGHWGKRSLSIANPTEKDLGYWKTTVPVKPDTLYTLSVYSRCQRESGQPEVVVSPTGKTFRDPGGHDFYLPATTHWQQYTQTFKTEPGQTGMEIELILYGRPEQKVWFDDLSLVEAASLPQMRGAWPEPGSVVRGKVSELLCQPAREPERYLFEIARDAYFERDLARLGPLDGTRCKLAKALLAGTWHWRVGVVDDQGMPHFAEASSFLIPAGVSQFRRADTTPPAAFHPRPAPDSTVDNGEVAISALFADAYSGIDVASVRLTLDGKDVTASATVTADGITYRAPQPLAKGVHQAQVTVRDAAGNAGNVLAWRFGVGVPVPVTARFDSKGAFLLNGAPHFPMGLYSYCCNPGAGDSAAKLMTQASDAGLDAQLVEDTGSQETLDRLLDNGMKVMLQARGGLAAASDEAKAREAMVDKGPARWKTHPALLGYWADEPDNTDPAFMARGYQALKAADPDHPAVWCLCQPEKYKQNAVSSDGIMPDIYPVPSTPLSVIYTQLHQAIDAASGKPVWFIPQAFDWKITGGGKVTSPVDWRPTAPELRAMTYLGIVAGAKAIFYWASDTAATNDIVWYPAQWDEMLKTAGEVRYLGDTLAAAPVAGAPRALGISFEASGEGLYMAAWQQGDRTLVIAVNASTGPLEATFRLPAARKVRCLFENRELGQPGARFGDLFRPYEVHVYEVR